MNREPRLYPLDWPDGWLRTKARRFSAFRPHSLAQARSALNEELRRYGASNVVISTNMAPRRGGRPALPEDPGVAVYFVRKGYQHVIAADRYHSVEENVWALARVLEAFRAVERHGSPQILDAAFAGFAALPPGPDATPAPDWPEVLDLDRGALERLRPEQRQLLIDGAYRTLMRSAHPDRATGDDSLARRLNAAREAALREMGG